jgi:hypothetical protein
MRKNAKTGRDLAASRDAGQTLVGAAPIEQCSDTHTGGGAPELIRGRTDMRLAGADSWRSVSFLKDQNVLTG